jgi:hypothetical protein
MKMKRLSESNFVSIAPLYHPKIARNLPLVFLIRVILTWGWHIDLPGLALRGERPAINRLRYDTVLLKTQVNFLTSTLWARISQIIQRASLDRPVCECCIEK